ncbi:phosphatase domain-containing putative toxin [Clostridium sp. 'White wine YQ']|uniref:phosphatase domain-containing putative toxin n=1 Tax=Clostridium sp. 'White wine YQ' TaxID=3027474 RepID=UPI002366C117|nr:phytase [Clostridium sp. 'White wine YQ']MDD7793203.1 phytase [Clostridium sp. 'White wine YQ']
MMRKILKFSTLLLMILILTISSPINALTRTNTDVQAQDDEVHLVLDALNSSNLPKHFRKTTDKIDIKDSKILNLNGLENLNVSGSSQFTEHSLKTIKDALDTKKKIIVIDLREESHGFIDGNAISFKNKYNNANHGLTRREVIAKEKKDLKSIPKNEFVTFYNKPQTTLTPNKVYNEEKLVNSLGMKYKRIPVTDGSIPTNEAVDYFVKEINSLSKDKWIHFHCKEGIGRTTTFMIMFDSMKNYKDVKLEDIIKRQILLSGISTESIQHFYTERRINFLTTFYEYCTENGDKYKIKFSDWAKEKGY